MILISVIKETKHVLTVVFCQYFGTTCTSGILAAACVYILYNIACVDKLSTSVEPSSCIVKGSLKSPIMLPQVTERILNVQERLSPSSCTPSQMTDVELVLDGQFPQPIEDISYETAEQFGFISIHSKVRPSMLMLVRLI